MGKIILSITIMSLLLPISIGCANPIINNEIEEKYEYLHRIPLASGGDTIHVPGDYHYIKDAINAANPGDIIMVATGTYYENLLEVNKTLTILGENKYTTVIDGFGSGGVIIINGAEGVTISGFTIQNTRTDGIHLYESTDSIIKDNIISSCQWGLYIKSSNKNKIENNIISNCKNGITLRWSDGNEVINNIIENNDEGLMLSLSNFNEIKGNEFNNHRYGSGLTLIRSSECIGNIIGGKDDSLKNTFSYNKYGIFINAGWVYSKLVLGNNNIFNNNDFNITPRFLAWLIIIKSEFKN